MISDYGVLYTIGKIFLRVIRHCFHMLPKKNCFEEDMSVQSFGTIGVPILGLLGKSAI
jgi:hypothetical protein